MTINYQMKLPIDEMQIQYEFRKEVWEELKNCARVIGIYRNIFSGSGRVETVDILAMMNENMERVKIARLMINDGELCQARKLLNQVVW